MICHQVWTVGRVGISRGQRVVKTRNVIACVGGEKGGGGGGDYCKASSVEGTSALNGLPNDRLAARTQVRLATFSQHHVDGLDLALTPLQCMMRSFPNVKDELHRCCLAPASQLTPSTCPSCKRLFCLQLRRSFEALHPA